MEELATIRSIPMVLLVKTVFVLQILVVRSVKTVQLCNVSTEACAEENPANSDAPAPMSSPEFSAKLTDAEAIVKTMENVACIR